MRGDKAYSTTGATPTTRRARWGLLGHANDGVVDDGGAGGVALVVGGGLHRAALWIRGAVNGAGVGVVPSQVGELEELENTTATTRRRRGIRRG